MSTHNIGFYREIRKISIKKCLVWSCGGYDNFTWKSSRFYDMAHRAVSQRWKSLIYRDQ